jgi:hypothetical protein
MNMKDIRNVHIKLRKKYPPDILKPEILADISECLFEYLTEDNQPERSKREDVDKKGPGFKYDDPKASDIYL